MQHADADDLLRRLTGELENFEDIAKNLLPQPGDVPTLHGIDVCGGTLALRGAIGGDHIIYVDFKQRFDLQARILEERRVHADGRDHVHVAAERFAENDLRSENRPTPRLPDLPLAQVVLL